MCLTKCKHSSFTLLRRIWDLFYQSERTWSWIVSCIHG